MYNNRQTALYYTGHVLFYVSRGPDEGLVDDL